MWQRAAEMVGSFSSLCFLKVSKGLITWNSAREGFTSLGLLRPGSTHGTFRKISILETTCQKLFEAAVVFFGGGALFVSFSFVVISAVTFVTEKA